MVDDAAQVHAVRASHLPSLEPSLMPLVLQFGQSAHIVPLFVEGGGVRAQSVLISHLGSI